MDDELKNLQRLAGINVAPLLKPYIIGEPGTNLSGTEKATIQRENKIRPGDEAWFKLWFGDKR